MKVYTSDSYLVLTKQLASNIKHSTNNIFQPELIVGADYSTQQFIRENIAEYNSVAANLLFVNWSKFFQMVFYYLKPNTFDFHILSDTKATQLLYEALDHKTFKENNPFIADYYLDNRQKQFGLARKLFNLYHNYIKYEPQFMQHWHENSLFTQDKNEIWQSNLWQVYRESLKVMELHDSFDIYTALTKALQGQSDELHVLQKKIPTLHIVRTENLSIQETILLKKLANYINISVYQLQFNKSNLITKQWAIDFDQFTSNTEHFYLKNNESDNKDSISLLNKIQNSLLHNSQCDFNKDSSIQIHGHYTTYREIEGLFNSLIYHAENNNQNFQSRECIVYCCDLKPYIPAIHYFFNQKNYTFPYRIVGERLFDSTTSLNALQEMFALDIDQMKPSILLKIMEYPSIKNKFNIEDITTIKTWIHSTNIRFAYFGDEDKETNLVSWKTGLDRMLLGSCTGVNDWYDDNTLMVDLAEANSFDLLINFRYFVDNFYAYKQLALQNKTKKQWVDYTKEFINFFFTPEQDDLLQDFIYKVDQLETDNNTLISFNIWMLFISPLLADVSEYKRPNVNGITFMELGNAQILPKSITAIIGLNYDNYPRKTTQLDFDLLKNVPEFKKTMVKEIDKNNFLQAILQTNELLYLSYNSHSSQDNSEIPPSILIEQLFDFVNKDKKVLSITYHPLHGFNSNYNKSTDLISYTIKSEQKNIFKELITTLETDNNEDEYSVMPHQFINYFNDSFKDFYRSQLGLYDNDDDYELEDEEIFNIDNLEAWTIRNWYIENGINLANFTKEERTKCLKNFKIHGQLPLSTLGEATFEVALEKYQETTNLFFTHTATKTRRNITINQLFQTKENDIRFVGNMTIYDRTYYLPHLSSNTVKGKFTWLINSYILFAQNEIDEAILLYEQTNTRKTISKQVLVTKDSFERIFSSEQFNQLLEFFIRGKHELQPFYLFKAIKEYETSDELLNALNKMDFLSDYVAQEIKKTYFIQNEDWKQFFLDNNNFLFHLTNIE